MNELDKFKDHLAEGLFGASKTICNKLGVCVMCHQEITEFRDALSRKKYGISGLCQECQDSIFDKKED